VAGTATLRPSLATRAPVRSEKNLGFKDTDPSLGAAALGRYPAVPASCPAAAPCASARAAPAPPSAGRTGWSGCRGTGPPATRPAGPGRPGVRSLIELSWIAFSRARLFSSSGAARTSSSSCLIMLPIRMTLAGCSTISVTGRSPPSSWGSPDLAIPSGPTTRTWGCSCISGLLILLVCPPGRPRQTTGSRRKQQDLAHVLAGGYHPVRLGRLRHGQLPVDAPGENNHSEPPNMCTGYRNYAKFVLRSD
jgi:hypothetical protein